jgi:hypothetical protein
MRLIRRDVEDPGIDKGKRRCNQRTRNEQGCYQQFHRWPPILWKVTFSVMQVAVNESGARAAHLVEGDIFMMW